MIMIERKYVGRFIEEGASERSLSERCFFFVEKAYVLNTRHANKP